MKRKEYDLFRPLWPCRIGYNIICEPVDVTISVPRCSRDGLEWWSEEVVASGFMWHHKVLSKTEGAEFTLN